MSVQFKMPARMNTRGGASEHRPAEAGAHEAGRESLLGGDAVIDRAAVVCTDSYAGRQEHPCRVVGETPKRYRIEVDQPTALPPQFSLLMPGTPKLVPKRAIRFMEVA